MIDIESITKEYVIIVEGNDDKRLVDDLLKAEAKKNSIQVVNAQSKSNIPALLKNFSKQSGIYTLKKLAIILDADRNPSQEKLSIEKHIKKAGIPSNVEISFLIVPENREGMLEDICMNSVDSDPTKNCIDEFLTCIEPQVEELPRNASKSRFLAFMATRPKATNGTIEAALQKGYFDLTHSAFDPIRNFLKDFVN